MNQITTQPCWDQLDDEPDAAYVRFLAYRNLGPARSVNAAHASITTDKTAKIGPSLSQWRADSSRFAWVSRANAWDIHVFKTTGVQAAITYGAAIKALADRVLNLLAKLEKADLKTLLKAIHVLSDLLPPDTIYALLGESAAGSGGPPTAPAPVLPAGAARPCTASLSENELARG
jgi:hypothetical protein